MRSQGLFYVRAGAHSAARVLGAAFLASLAVALAGCSTDLKTAFQSFALISQSGSSAVDHAELAPKFRYLRITFGPITEIFALDRLETHPDGPIDVWYSYTRTVLRIQNGRLVGATGFLTEWRGVRLPNLPAWSKIAAASEPLRWERTRDLMPGYRFGIRDELVLRSIPPPAKSALRQVDPHTLTWFEERSDSNPAALQGAALPPARYAVSLSQGSETVVYAEQCLAPDLCLTWQSWSSELQEANKLKVTRARQ